jgi:glycosyltransferase involved in cell wall biosynthesis
MKGKDQQRSGPTYVLITPARNEEAYIELTIQSMIAQAVPPVKWVIVSDGSTDRTDEIVKSYAEKIPWMEFIRRPAQADRNFASKVHSFNAGYARVKDLEYDIIGNLDADLSFEKDMLEHLLDKFAQFPSLGVAGPPFYEVPRRQYNYRYANIEHVTGMLQLFRRECFEAIGGYTPIPGGGIDWVAVTAARMKGWKTRTFTEKYLLHHRPMGTGGGNILSARYRIGKEDYYLGSHPLWEFLRACYHIKDKPYVLGSMLMFVGYVAGFLLDVERPIPEELTDFYRKEQLARLWKLFRVV